MRSFNWRSKMYFRLNIKHLVWRKSYFIGGWPEGTNYSHKLEHKHRIRMLSTAEKNFRSFGEKANNFTIYMAEEGSGRNELAECQECTPNGNGWKRSKKQRTPEISLAKLWLKAANWHKHMLLWRKIKLIGWIKRNQAIIIEIWNISWSACV